MTLTTWAKVVAPELLPTPTAQAAKHGVTPDVHRNSKLGSNLWDLPHLLPTPQAWDGARGPDLARANRPNSGGMDLVTTVTRLLPTPVVNDMGAGKTIEEWDSWTAEMKAKHGNSNGHGPSLSIEVQRLLPTPRAQNGEARNMKP